MFSREQIEIVASLHAHYWCIWQVSVNTLVTNASSGYIEKWGRKTFQISVSEAYRFIKIYDKQNA